MKDSNKILFADDHTIVNFNELPANTEHPYLNASYIMVGLS